ncbi:MAG TPA: FtsX-like permease family protein [Methylomirabilota bacterium]
MTLRFALRMAWRQMRGAWRHFLTFFACIALGVAALVSVGTLAASLDGAVAREAKALTGGDLELRSARPLDAQAQDALARLRVEGARTTAVRELAAMARHPATGATLLVEIKAVEPAYPLYGRVQVTPPRPDHPLVADATALVEQPLLDRLGLAVGDGLLLGAVPFTITGVIEREPDRAASFVTLGPRVMIDAGALEPTGLTGFGSRVRYRTLVRLGEGASARAAHEALERAIADPSVRVTAFDEARPGLRRFFSQLTTYLGLVGLASLFVGGIGVASSVAMFVRRQLSTIAVLKCLGAESRALLAAYLVQIQALAVIGSLAGAGLGVLVQPALVRVVQPFAPIALEPSGDVWTLVRGLLMGTLTALLCAVWPLLAVRAVPPSLILRRDVQAAGWRAPRPWAAALPIAAGLAALAFWQAGSLKLGAIFVGAALVALVVLAALARTLILLVRTVPPGGGLAWRQGLAGLRRPGGHALRVVVALGTGVMLLVAIALLEANLSRQIAFERKHEAPSFFFVDVQGDQREPFAGLVTRASGGVAPALTPVVRGRLAAIDGVPLSRELVEAKRAAAPDKVWYFTREYVLTFAAEPPAGTAITRGRWWTAAEAAQRPRVSLEDEAARHLGVAVGDSLVFDVQGVRLEVEVMSLRHVDWQSLAANFFAILSPGALEGAPLTYVATARVPAAAESELQDQVVATFPNITAIPVRAVLERVAALFAQIGFAVRLMALFSITVGLTVIASTLAATRHQRLYETVILKTLGATRATVARAFAVEYACLGAVSGLGGVLLAAVLTWVVHRFVLDAQWTLELLPLAAGAVGATAVALAVGGLATLRLLGRAPLAVLRQD